jgi:hypothetical protein
MRRYAWLALFCILGLTPMVARADFNPADYKSSTQADLVKNAEAAAGKKFQVTDPFQFCGSDFCVQQKMKINTREYYCFTLGQLCLVRMYIKKDHPEAPVVLGFKKGDKVTVYGTFDKMGSNFNYIVVDRVTVEKKP